MKKTYIIMGVFVALAMLVSYIEVLIPFSFVIPGIKLGLTNIVVVTVLYSFGEKEALSLSMVRIILMGFLFGNMSSILYSISGSLCSLAIMSALKRTHKFSLIGVSIAGGVFHNIGQVLIASLVVENFYVLFYMPTLMIVGIITGFLIGLVVKEVMKRIPKDYTSTPNN